MAMKETSGYLQDSFANCWKFFSETESRLVGRKKLGQDGAAYMGSHSGGGM